jgi:hypothetical protein
VVAPSHSARTLPERTDGRSETDFSVSGRSVLGYHRAGPFSLRYVLTHLIEEYARHNGHADLLRERLDGSTGE